MGVVQVSCRGRGRGRGRGRVSSGRRGQAEQGGGRRWAGEPALAGATRAHGHRAAPRRAAHLVQLVAQLGEALGEVGGVEAAPRQHLAGGEVGHAHTGAARHACRGRGKGGGGGRWAEGGGGTASSRAALGGRGWGSAAGAALPAPPRRSQAPAGPARLTCRLPEHVLAGLLAVDGGADTIKLEACRGAG
jgi:hypothetical protein